jgi:hypothetical protein
MFQLATAESQAQLAAALDLQTMMQDNPQLHAKLQLTQSYVRAYMLENTLAKAEAELASSQAEELSILMNLKLQRGLWVAAGLAGNPPEGPAR